MTSYVYLHGFASSPASSKAQFFRSRLAERGATLAIPALDEGDFEHLTLTKQLQFLDRELRGEAAVLLGSSLGGYLAALYAERHPEVQRLLLLAPAFDFRARWAARVGDDEIAEWRSTGSRLTFHYGEQRERPIHYELFEDAAQYAPYPAVSQPALVLHGRFDTVVSPEVAERFAELRPNARVELFNSSHELTDVLDELWQASEPFLFP